MNGLLALADRLCLFLYILPCRFDARDIAFAWFNSRACEVRGVGVRLLLDRVGGVFR